MKNLLATLAALLVCSLLGFTAPQDKAFSGEIMDSACAKAGSHDVMMAKTGLTSAKDCTQACVKNGSKYVLYDKTTRKVYELDDQSSLGQYAGETVSIKGSLDATSNTIHVMDIGAAKGPK